MIIIIVVLHKFRLILIERQIIRTFHKWIIINF